MTTKTATTATTTTGATSVQNTTKTITRTVYGWTKLDSAVIKQLGHGAPKIVGYRVTITVEAAHELADVGRCSCGAAGGFGGFIYYYETYDFYVKNRDAIREALEQLAEEIGDGCAIDFVRGFSCFKGDAVTYDDIGRMLWGQLPGKWEEHRNASGEWVSGAEFDKFCVANSCAFFALEETARKWNDCEEYDDDDAEEGDAE